MSARASVGLPVGWFYDSSPRCPHGRIAFTDGSEVGLEHPIRLVCGEAAETGPTSVGIGTSCVGDPRLCDGAPTSYPRALGCDLLTSTCQARCDDTSDCGRGEECVRGWCVNPTCR